MTKHRILLLAVVWFAAAASAAPERGRDPFVFRAVLDERPRMLVLALRLDFWVAYDAERAALYKVWEGGVNSTGAVYDWLHGPQPTSQGRAWVVSPWQEPWELRLGGRTLPARVRWRGHRLSETGVTLLYDVYADDTGPIQVSEVPDERRAADGTHVFVRRFTTSGVPNGAEQLPRVQLRARPSGRTQAAGRGSVVRISARDGSVETLARGLRAPNGIGLGPGGRIFVTDNQGDWLPASKLLHVAPGAFFGSHAIDFAGVEQLPVTPPIVWLPHSEVGNRFSQGFEAGVNRLAWAPDGKLYVGGIGGPGDWGQPGRLWYGLERLAYNGRPTFELLAVRVHANGIEIELSEPLGAGAVAPADFAVSDFRYQPTPDYGGPKLDERALPVRAVELAPDRRRIFLALEGLAEGRVLHLEVRGTLANARGQALWSREAWYTLNRLPARGATDAAPAT